MRRMLGGFTPGYGDTQPSGRAYRIPVPSSKLAVPVLAREVMVVFGAEYRGRWDKVAWRYGFSVDGVPQCQGDKRVPCQDRTAGIQ